LTNARRRKIFGTGFKRRPPDRPADKLHAPQGLPVQNRSCRPAGARRQGPAWPCDPCRSV